MEKRGTNDIKQKLDTAIQSNGAVYVRWDAMRLGP